MDNPSEQSAIFPKLRKIVEKMRPKNNPLALCHWTLSNVLNRLNEEEQRKAIQNFILFDSILNKEVFLQKCHCILPLFRILLEKNALSEAMDAVIHFLKFQAQDYERHKKAKDKENVEKATKARSDKAKELKDKLMEELRPYLIEVENLWHPILPKNDEEEEKKKKRACSTGMRMDRAIKKVYEEHKKEIGKVLRKNHIPPKIFESRFKKVFGDFTDASIEAKGTTMNKYPKEKRQGRNEESRERSRQGQKRKLNEKKALAQNKHQS